MSKVVPLLLFFGGSMVLQGCGGDGTTSTTSPPSTPAPVDLWACSSSRTLPAGIVAPEKKGMAVDDTSMSDCSDELTGVWPHASEQITSLRLFAAWKPEWNESLRNESWQTLQQFVEATNAKVLLGTEVTFDQEADDQMWSWGLELMQLLGKDHIMGVSVGNEMDNQDGPDGFWDHGFFDLIKSRVDDMDAAGFVDTPITVVWSMGALAEQPWNGKISTLMTQANNTWGSRWAWSFNPYPIWDMSQQPSSPDDCAAKVDAATSLDYTRNVMGNARDRVAEFVGSDDYLLWVTESGWSSPGVSTQPHINDICPLWHDQETLWNFYKNMMEWDLSLPNGDHGVDHFFYFTMRDACQHGICEGFGLISQCGDTACKVNETLDIVMEV